MPPKLVPASTVPPSPSLPAALAAWINLAVAQYPQRGPVFRALALASICAVPINVLLLGPPGTAKTRIVTEFFRAVSATLCARTMSAWTDDSALLGPVDIAALNRGELRRATTPGLLSILTAMATFVDELGRAGRGVRDLLLSALADRATPDGIVVPSHVIVAASNTRLVDDDDRALVDRFAMRVDVPRVTGPALRAVITRSVPVDGKHPIAMPLPALPLGIVETLRARAADVSMPGPVADAIERCAAALRQPAPSGATYPDVSERRWILATRLLQASAVLDDRDEIDFGDVLSTLPGVLDEGPESRAAIEAAIKSSIPAWVSGLADLRAACDAAVARARRIEVDRAPTSPADSDAHVDREKTLRALAAALAAYGADVKARADAAVLAALDACDDAAEEGLTRSRAARKPGGAS
jgi:MoxR-like ATPase